jgi:hypothetical protein
MDFGPVTAERHLTSGDSPIPDQTAHGHQASATTTHEGMALRASKALTHGAKPNSGHALRRASNRAMTVGTTGLSGRGEPFAGEVARSGAIARCADAGRPRHSGHRHQSGSKTSSPENHRSMPSGRVKDLLSKSGEVSCATKPLSHRGRRSGRRRDRPTLGADEKVTVMEKHTEPKPECPGPYNNLVSECDGGPRGGIRFAS